MEPAGVSIALSPANPLPQQEVVMDLSQRRGLEAAGDERVPVVLEVCMQPDSTASPQEVSAAVEAYLSTRSLVFRDGKLPWRHGEDPYLDRHVQSITVCDTDRQPWIRPVIHAFQLCEEGGVEEEDDCGEDAVSSFREWTLPSRDLDGLWASLVYDSSIKQRLLRFAATALQFSDAGVDPSCISCNRTVLLHGPPGTGKTSLCKALAQRLAVRWSWRYPAAQLIEVNAHSLFSKWFSESGKLVSRLFAKITERVEEDDCLVFVLIDEVESLTAARKAAVSGSEPADAIRAVNALLTHLDALKRFPNAMVLTTSNITEAIDLAFVDRADIKAYIGPPDVKARYEILRSCVAELQRVGIVRGGPELPSFEAAAVDAAGPETTLSSPAAMAASPATPAAAKRRGQANGACAARHADANGACDGTEALSGTLLHVAAAADGLSGRALRKLPFLAHAQLDCTVGTPAVEQFVRAMLQAVQTEMRERALVSG